MILCYKIFYLKNIIVNYFKKEKIKIKKIIEYLVLKLLFYKNIYIF